MKAACSPTEKDRAWFERWFNEDYLLVYPHRDQVEADRQVAAVLSLLANPTVDCLDLGCGSGRHARALSAAGKRVCAIDLSLHLLRTARAGAATDATFIRSDIRYLPFRDASFDLLTSFFTSFGYFAFDHEHLAALREWQRVLRPHGTILLDLPDRAATLSGLQPLSERRLADGRKVTERRTLSEDERRVEKVIAIEDGEAVHSYQESVRLFSESEILALLREAGFDPPRRVAALDGFAGRMVVTAGKRGREA